MELILREENCGQIGEYAENEPRMEVARAGKDGVQANEHAKEGEEDESGLNDPGPDGGNRWTLGRKRKIDGRLGVVGTQDSERHELTGSAAPQFIEKNDSSS